MADSLWWSFLMSQLMANSLLKTDWTRFIDFLLNQSIVFRGILLRNPILYHCITHNNDVYFGSRITIRKSLDLVFPFTIKWFHLPISGYPHIFVTAVVISCFTWADFIGACLLRLLIPFDNPLIWVFVYLSVCGLWSMKPINIIVSSWITDLATPCSTCL